MRCLICLCLILLSLIGNSQGLQPPVSRYTPVNTNGYSWLRGHFKALHIPNGDTVLTTGQWDGPGAVVYRTVDNDNSFYIYDGLKWNKVTGSGSGSSVLIKKYGRGIETNIVGDSTQINVDTVFYDNRFDSLLANYINLESNRLRTSSEILIDTAGGRDSMFLDRDEIVFTDKFDDTTTNHRTRLDTLESRMSNPDYFIRNTALNGLPQTASIHINGGFKVNRMVLGAGSMFTNSEIYPNTTYTGILSRASGNSLLALNTDGNSNGNGTGLRLHNNGILITQLVTFGSGTTSWPASSTLLQNEISSLNFAASGTDNLSYISLGVRGNNLLAQRFRLLNNGNVVISPTVSTHTDDGARFQVVSNSSNNNRAANFTGSVLISDTLFNNATLAAGDSSNIVPNTAWMKRYGASLSVGGGSGSGTVNTGAGNRLAYYASSGTAVSELAAITANRVLLSNANGLPSASSVTNTTLGYLDATSSIQTQFNTISTDVSEMRYYLAADVSTAGALTTILPGRHTSIHYYNIAANLTSISAPTGPKTPLDGYTFTFKMIDNGVARTITGWDSKFRSINPDIPLPTTTEASKLLYLTFTYNQREDKWDLVFSSVGGSGGGGASASSGTYTPTLTNVATLSASTPILLHYRVIDNEVHVQGSVTLTTSGAGNFELGISLPGSHTSDFTAATDASGYGVMKQTGSGAAFNCFIEGDATNNRAAMKGYAAGGATATFFFSFSYTKK